MKRNRVFVAISAVFVLFLLFLAFVLVSRGLARGDDHRFVEILSEADGFSASGMREKALAVLRKARKNAVSTSHWLSLAKREIQLDELVQAEKTLVTAAARFPANDRISAVLVYVLLRSGKPAETERLLPFLKGTDFAPLAAYAEVVSGLFASTVPQIPGAYVDAWRFSGNPVFRRDAAVLYAREGDYRQAFNAVHTPAEASAPTSTVSVSDVRLEGEDLFRALIAYDAGLFGEVAHSLAFPGVGGGGWNPRFSAVPAGLSPEETLLAADAFYMAGEPECADFLWKMLSEDEQPGSPIPFFNHSIYAPSWFDKRETLRKCLDVFPAYHPALASYVRCAVPADSPEVVLYGDTRDFAVRALSEAGLVSVNMEESALNKPVSLPEAREALDAALAAVRGGNAGSGVGEAGDATDNDSRVMLEEIRFLCFQLGKDAEARHALWNLLETRRGDSLSEAFAVWFFAVQDDFAPAFEILNRAQQPDPVYKGMAAAATGDLEKAAELFSSAADVPDSDEAAAASANGAVILKTQGKYNEAADCFVSAGESSGDEKFKSRMYFEAAVVFEMQKAYTRAVDMLRNAISLDKDNYRAKVLLQKLEDSFLH